MITPLIIKDADCQLYGILRYPPDTKAIVIFLPAASGTRVGPQRIYVQTSNHLIKRNKATLCIDIPPHGDSFDYTDRKYITNGRERLIQHYAFYLDKIINYLNENYKFEEYILCSISAGCIPILNYAKANYFKKIIMLSPNHLENSNAINKKNLKTYYHKLFRPETWLKIFTFNVQYKKIFNNILINNNNLTKKDKVSTFKNKSVSVLCIFGEKDEALMSCHEYWKKQLNNGYISKYDEKIIDNADHSFFGWNFKEKVASHIMDWL
jgi:hypothetical protein